LFEACLAEALLEGHSVDQAGLGDAASTHLAHLDVGILEALEIHDGVHQHVAEEEFVVTH